MASQNLQTISGRDTSPAFLRVDCSARNYRWVERLGRDGESVALAISQTHGVQEILARILTARGCRPETTEQFLNPTLRDLMPDPSSLQDMDKAVERFVATITAREPIAIFGDYDVDGASSVALICHFLRVFGIEPAIYIPDRQLEGYGPNDTAFEQLIADGAKLIVTVDCGTVSHGPVARAKELGADVIVLDHHQTGEKLPDANAVVNPNRQDDISGQGHLAAAGVVFLFLVAVARALRDDSELGERVGSYDLMQTLDLVALGTVCDVVPLTGLNRALVKRGLEMMHMRRNVGLRALSDAAGMTAAPTAFHLGFVLGPRLNAGGRIGRSDLAARLLTCVDDTLAGEIAGRLNDLNAERQLMQQELQEEALAQAEAMFETRPEAAVVVVQGEGWHKGLVGLVAAKLTERFTRPSLVIAWDKDGLGSGSARSIQGVDLGAAIRAAHSEGLLERGGGHAMAAGFTLRRDMAETFCDYMDDILGDAVARAASAPELRFDAALMASSATLELLDELEKAGPFGAGNPQPRFAFASHRCRYPKIVGDKHVRCTLAASDGSKLSAIAFNSAGTELGDMLLSSDGALLHFSGHLRRSDWGGRQKTELHIDDAARPQN